MDKVFQYRLRAAFFYWVWLPGLVLGFGTFFDSLFNLKPWPASLLQTICAVIVLMVGLIFIAWSDRDLARLGGGTPSPAQPAKRLVMDGSFALCRHPMHFGYSLAALAVLFFYRSPSALFLCYPLFLGWQWIFLKKEESNLLKRFRQEYPDYCSRVPSLIPSLLSRKHI